MLKADDIRFIERIQCDEHKELVRRVNVILYIVIANLFMSVLTSEQGFLFVRLISKALF